VVCRVLSDEAVRVLSETEESLVRLVESPATETEPVSTLGAESVTHRSLRRRLISCQSSELARHVEPEICGYYHAVSRTSASFQETERVDTSNDWTSSVTDSHNQSSVNFTDGNQLELEPSSELDNTTSSSSSPAAAAVAKVTSDVRSDAEPVSESAVVDSAVPGTDVTLHISFLHSFYSGHHESSFSLLSSDFCNKQL